MITNREYSDRVGLVHRKKYAQFFTPKAISDFMASWVLADGRRCKEVLDPAFGLGVFGDSLLGMNRNVKVTGFDIDDCILSAAQENFSSMRESVSIVKQDYLTSSWEKKYDGIICNPPYFKFHDYDNAYYISDVNRRLDTRLNGFTNIYTLFLLKSIHQLKERGRLAYIIPSEFMNSDYGVEVKRTLVESNVLKHVVIVDFNECAFDDALTTASILLCEKNESVESVRFSVVKDVSCLGSCLDECKSYKPSELDVNVKWKQYYEPTNASKFRNLVPFNIFAKVTRGIATGANEYFTFNRAKSEAFNIPKGCLLPCICHVQDVRTAVFTEGDFRMLADANKNVYLFDGHAGEEDAWVKRYLELGRQHGYDKRYLTASRTPWYSIENRPAAPIWVSVFNRRGLRFVRNEANVRNLTTFHCVYTKGVVDTDILFSYLLTSVAQQIFLDNSRQYGNGLVKFEPNDLNKGMVVDLSLLNKDEKGFVKSIYDLIRQQGDRTIELVGQLDAFFLKKYTDKV